MYDCFDSFSKKKAPSKEGALFKEKYIKLILHQ